MKRDAMDMVIKGREEQYDNAVSNYFEQCKRKAYEMMRGIDTGGEKVSDKEIKITLYGTALDEKQTAAVLEKMRGLGFESFDALKKRASYEDMDEICIAAGVTPMKRVKYVDKETGEILARYP